MNSTETDKVWLITGCSTGMGRDIALAALAHGYRVVVTARNVSSVDDIVRGYPQRASAIALDVTDPRQIDAALAHTLATFGQLDVLVNNAGYGYVAAIEEGEDSEVRAMFETNFFGLLAMTKAVLSHMRARGSGHIINNSSQAGLMANPGTGYYSASKYAVEALNEALAREMAPFGVKVSAIEPGAFRTDWAGRSMKRTTTPLPAYAESVGQRADMIAAMSGKQPGDPRRAAEAVIALVQSPQPPTQLLLGRGVLDTYRAKLQAVGASLDAWEAVTLGADFPAD